MSQAVDLLQAEYANEAFYLAFESKDLDAMSHLWSEARDIICLHPGWPVLVGRTAVMDSWKSILSNPDQAAVSFYGASCHQLSADSVAVVCYETAVETTLVATNIFVVEDERLRLVCHQSGYCANPPER
jgi:hypothetical protein